MCLELELVYVIERWSKISSERWPKIHSGRWPKIRFVCWPKISSECWPKNRSERWPKIRFWAPTEDSFGAVVVWSTISNHHGFVIDITVYCIINHNNV